MANQGISNKRSRSADPASSRSRCSRPRRAASSFARHCCLRELFSLWSDQFPVSPVPAPMDPSVSAPARSVRTTFAGTPDHGRRTFARSEGDILGHVAVWEPRELRRLSYSADMNAHTDQQRFRPDPSPVTKAVVPAAGLGTRFLPATKATPKEMLPIVDKPAIQYVVEEAVDADLTDVLMITRRNKRSIEDHFDRAHELEEAPEAKGDEERLRSVREPNDLAQVHYVRQVQPRGLEHAVLCAESHVGDNPFAVLLGDDLIESADLLRRMIEVRNDRGGSVVALME